MPRRFVIPDIHGCALTLRLLLHERLRISREDTIYLLGDLIDRGPRSKEVLDEVRQLKRDGFTVLSVRGNHEEMLLSARSDPAGLLLWGSYGGTATLASFRATDASAIPYPYVNLCASLPHYLLLPDFVLVHAGLNLDRADPFSDTDAMLWIRTFTVDRGRLGGRRVICGHTPVPLDAVRASLATDRIMLDNGCVYGHQGGLGNLTALDLDTFSLMTQKNIDF